MVPLDPDELARIAQARGIVYEPLPSESPLTVSTRMSRVFPIERTAAFNMFCDPATHVRLFCIIKGSATIPRDPIAKIVPPNQFWVIEHVQERDSMPRTMLVRYTVSPPDVIIKQGVPDPFGDLDSLGGVITPYDKKKALVIMRLDYEGQWRTKVIVESTFLAKTGEIFMRGLIDHVWLNFFENLMVELGELLPSQILTRP